MKICKRCGIEKIETDFTPSQSWCRSCRKDYDHKVHTGEHVPKFRRIRKKQETPDGNKTCNKCKRRLPLDCFYTNGVRRGKTQYRSYCKACQTFIQRTYNKIKPQVRRKSRLKTIYNTTPEKIQELFESQERCCAVCQTTDPGGKPWSIDHDHSCCPGEKSCGKCIRGVLCMKCNNALGCINDSVEILIRAIKYLNKHKKK